MVTGSRQDVSDEPLRRRVRREDKDSDEPLRRRVRREDKDIDEPQRREGAKQALLLFSYKWILSFSSLRPLRPLRLSSL